MLAAQSLGGDRGRPILGGKHYYGNETCRALLNT
jgi:hypothetical protein